MFQGKIVMGSLLLPAECHDTVTAAFPRAQEHTHCIVVLLCSCMGVYEHLCMYTTVHVYGGVRATFYNSRL